MFWLEGGIELLTPRWEPAILSTRPEGITLNVNDFIKIYTTRPKIKIFFWHHARYYRHLVPKYKLKIYVLTVNNILHDAKKIFQFLSSSIYFPKILYIQCNTLWSSG